MACGSARSGAPPSSKWYARSKRSPGTLPLDELRRREMQRTAFASLSLPSAPSRTLSCTKENRSRRFRRPDEAGPACLLHDRVRVTRVDRGELGGLGRRRRGGRGWPWRRGSRGSRPGGGRADGGRGWLPRRTRSARRRCGGRSCHPRGPDRGAPDSTNARTTEVRTNGRPPETRLITACASSGTRPIIDVTRSRAATSSNGRSSTVLALGQPITGWSSARSSWSERRHHGHVAPGRSRRPIVRRP